MERNKWKFISNLLNRTEIFSLMNSRENEILFLYFICIFFSFFFPLARKLQIACRQERKVYKLNFRDIIMPRLIACIVLSFLLIPLLPTLPTTLLGTSNQEKLEDWITIEILRIRRELFKDIKVYFRVLVFLQHYNIYLLSYSIGNLV